MLGISRFLVNHYLLNNRFNIEAERIRILKRIQISVATGENIEAEIYHPKLTLKQALKQERLAEGFARYGKSRLIRVLLYYQLNPSRLLDFYRKLTLFTAKDAKISV